MKINKIELQKALEKVKPGLANKEIIEQSTSFAFIGDRVYTYNDEISISHPVKELNITGAIKAQTLYAFIAKLKKDEINIEKEENQIIIKAGKSKAGLILEQEIKLPIRAEIDKIKNWTELPDDFLEALQLCHQCCSDDMSRPVLTCIHIKDNSVEASDSYQIIRYKLKAVFSSEVLLIPASAVRELIKYPIKKIAKKDNWVHFKTDDETIFSSRTIEDTFPDIAAHLKIKGKEFSFPPTIHTILEKAQVFSKNIIDVGDMPLVTIEINENQLKVSAKNEHGWFEETARINYTGSSFSFCIGIDFLIKLLGKEQKCVIGNNAIKFTGENWEHVVVAMANNKEENA